MASAYGRDIGTDLFGFLEAWIYLAAGAALIALLGVAYFWRADSSRWIRKMRKADARRRRQRMKEMR